MTPIDGTDLMARPQRYHYWQDGWRTTLCGWLMTMNLKAGTDTQRLNGDDGCAHCARMVSQGAQNRYS